MPDLDKAHAPLHKPPCEEQLASLLSVAVHLPGVHGFSRQVESICGFHLHPEGCFKRENAAFQEDVARTLAEVLAVNLGEQIKLPALFTDGSAAAAEMFDVLPFDQIMDQTSGFTQMAAIPGPSTGIVQALLNADLPTKRAYTDDMFKAISTPDGANIPARALGMSPPMREGFGPWQNMMEPNRTIDFSVATNNGGMDKAIDPSSAKAAGTMREWNQFLLGQEGSGFTTPRVDGAAAPRMKDGAPTRADLGNIASIKGVKMDSPKSFQKATNALEKIYGPNWSDAVVVQAGRNGEMLLKNITGKNNTEFQKAASEVHRMMGGVGQERMRDVGNDFRYVQFNDPSYRTLMDETRNNPVLKKTFDEKVLPHIGRLQKVSETWAKKMGVPADTVPDRVRRIFMKAGENWPQAMDEAVKKGIIPAAAATFLYGQLGTERGTQ